jgi:hypothetical protein
MNETSIIVDSENCKTCGIPFQGDFCHACGQKRIYKRFTLKESSKWVFSEVFNLDHGFLYTSKEMLFRPNVVIKEYLSGSTKKYMHPFRFLFVWVTINSLLTLWLGVLDNNEAFQDLGIDIEGKEFKKVQEVLALVQKYMTFIMMLGVPFMAFGSWMIYKKRKLYYTEHLIFQAYTYGGSIILSLPIMALLYLPNGIYLQANIGMVVYLLYFTFVFYKYFKEHFMEAFIKVLISFIIAILCGMIIGIITSVPITLFYAKYFKG